MNGSSTDPTSSASAAGGPAARLQGRMPPGFCELAQLAAEVFEAPLASIVLLQWSETWFSSGALTLIGLPDDPFLGHTLSAAEAFEVHDMTADERFAGPGSGLSAAGVRSYAGCALRAGGEVLGALAIYRTGTTPLSAQQRAMLRALARQGAALAGLHAAAKEFVPADLSPATALAETLLGSAPVAIYYSGVRSESVYVNPAYRRMFRLAPTQSVDDWPKAVHPDDRARMEESWGDFLRSPRAARFEYRALGDAEAVRYFAEQVVPTEGVSGFIGTISDITDLVSTRTLLEAVIGDLPVALVACDADGRLTHYNRAAIDLFGSPPKEHGWIADLFLMDGVTPVPGDRSPLERALGGETITNLELIVAPPGVAPRAKRAWPRSRPMCCTTSATS